MTLTLNNGVHSPLVTIIMSGLIMIGPIMLAVRELYHERFCFIFIEDCQKFITALVTLLTSPSVLWPTTLQILKVFHISSDSSLVPTSPYTVKTLLIISVQDFLK